MRNCSPTSTRTPASATSPSGPTASATPTTPSRWTASTPPTSSTARAPAVGLAALQLQHRQRSHGRRALGGHLGLRLERQQPALASARVHPGSSRQRLHVRRPAGRHQRRADRRQHLHRHQQLARPGLRHLCQQLINASPFFFNQQYQLATQGVGTFPESMANPFLRAGLPALRRAAPSRRTSSSSSSPISAAPTRRPGHRLSQFTVPTALTDDRSNAGLQCRRRVGRFRSPSRHRPRCLRAVQCQAPRRKYLIPSAQSSGRLTNTACPT
jgi:hypothetical protein